MPATHIAINTPVGTPLNITHSKERKKETERQDLSERETRNMTNISGYTGKELTLINLK